MLLVSDINNNLEKISSSLLKRNIDVKDKLLEVVEVDSLRRSTQSELDNLLARQARGLYFRNEIKELGLGIDFNFLEFDVLENSLQMTPFISTGISFFRYNALRYQIGVLEATKYGDASNISIPITLGYKIKPVDDFIFSFEITANHTYSDNLDGSEPGEKQKPSSYYFGSTLSQDWYVFTGISLTYIFGTKKCYCPN